MYYLSRIAPLAALALLGSGDLHAATNTWLETGPNNNWLNAVNYGGTGTLAPTNADTFVYDAGARGVTVNSSGTIGKLVVGQNYAVTNVNQAGGAVLTIQGGSAEVSSPGIEVLAGRTTNTNVHAKLILDGNTTISNSGSSRLRIGNPDNGNGGLGGSGTLNIRSGVTLLAENVSHTYSGAVTVDNNGTLQVPNTGLFTTYSNLSIGASGTLSGAGTVGAVDVHSGGRISPGSEGNIGAGPATLNFTSLLSLQSTGLLTLDVKAAGVDAINVTAGSIDLGGELRLRLNSDYSSSGTYQLIQGLDASSGNFNSVTIRTDANTTGVVSLTDIGNGIWTGNFAERGYDVSFDANTGTLNLASVPEPTLALLFPLGLAALILRRR
ncbi:PEP-CTERM sorting domain-containing protein [Luteolibacter luteus]|uniref:PEP-CTERM sorting domain-containing protein n=1 Tax=Luteolibacter luteus TaxID=2728835 RepID=A0A858RE53_9BACT|nr:PEP-CTERM sorting domain-containing protein [Luteolibacter luteus]QJE94453.1 PEP-CTERM sorting domain-containing protein [Luteolibacter luteus]